MVTPPRLRPLTDLSLNSIHQNPLFDTVVGYLGILDAVMVLKKSTEITEYNIIPIGHVVLLVFVGIFLVIISEWFSLSHRLLWFC